MKPSLDKFHFLCGCPWQTLLRFATESSSINDCPAYDGRTSVLVIDREKTNKKKHPFLWMLSFWLPQFDGKHQRVHKLRLFGLGFEPAVQVVIINHSPLWLQTVHRTVCLTRRALRALLGINACVTATCRRFYRKWKNKKRDTLLCISFSGSPSRIWTYDPPVNSRMLYRWAIEE